jgi:LemA protein
MADSPDRLFFGALINQPWRIEMIGFLVILGLVAAVVIWAVAIYNRLVRLRNLVEEGWSGIDVQLKRRADLIPNLLETVRGYMDHERDLLTRVTELRARSAEAGNVADKVKLEGKLSRSLARLFAVAENYPELKANQNFLQLQGQLGELEEQIQMARRYYNGTVRELNIKIESFPSNLVARRFGFNPAEFFEIEDLSDREVPEISFGN